jgi:cytochrome c
MKFLFLFAPFCLLLSGCARYDTPPRVLIFSKTNGYRHQSIEAGKEALVKICYENGILADTTENADFFEEKNLKRYAAVVFLNTNGEVLNPRQEIDFERFIQAGGGFLGVHSASATEYTWHWYGGLVGAYFKDHPAIQEVDLDVENCSHEATKHLNCKPWKWKEELYNFRNYEPDLTMLLTVNEATYQGGNSPIAADSGPPHPLAWCHSYDGGRAFYTALGHIPESYSDPLFQKHLLGGLRYAIGQNRPLRYDRCRSQRVPDPTRFVKTTLASDLDEPMEIAQFPDGKIILIERHGYVKLFDPATGLLNTVTKLPVYSEMGDGLLGVAIDPHWSQNHWIYLYYSALRDSVNQLSRFVFRADTLDRASEAKILEIPVGRKDCFHAAGSMAFDPAGNLFLATGDNTSPFGSDGFSPTDERHNKQAFDAQRSAANTRDLRGKILRIKILDNGNYICPKGNLFVAKDLEMDWAATPNLPEWLPGRPEIYIMGCRNPFRISYDERREFLFWGDIGPDAGKADTARGPMGHDEINRAKAAGNFGWPYFVGDNQAYRDYDFEDKKSGPPFDPQKPVNESINNTGTRELPPAQPAFIWYPYAKNRDFPLLGSGGRNAMAGPVYYADQYPSATRFPDYYDGKLVIYDWMRNWLMAVTLDSLGNFHRLEPFADSVKLSRPMDMFFDKNGSLWVLEYGTRWYSSNEDACLSRIDFVRGNRAPIAVLEADKTAGANPLKIQFKPSKSKDYDEDKLEYTLDFGDGTPRIFCKKADTIRHVYQQPGLYKASLKVSDPSGAFSASEIGVAAGNEPPTVFWDLNGHNRSFYHSGDVLDYKIMVQDLEDGSAWEGGIPLQNVQIHADYLEKGANPATFGKNQWANQPPEKFAEGKNLVEKSDCRSCHAVERQVNGPSFQAVAARYRGSRDFAVPSIYRKIIYGGSGNWGQGTMIPHPQIREEEAIQMALWILSLADPPKPPEQAIQPAGAYVLQQKSTDPMGTFVLRAQYRDQGAKGSAPLEGGETLLLRPATLPAENCDFRSEGVGNYKPFDNDTTVLQELKHNAFFVFRRADLLGIQSITLRIGFGDLRAPQAGGVLEIRADSPHGPLLGRQKIEQKNAARMVFEECRIPIQTAHLVGLRDVFFVFKNTQDQGRSVVAIDWLRFDF